MESTTRISRLRCSSFLEILSVQLLILRRSILASEMVRGCGFHFVTEVAPPKLIAVVKHKTPQMLDTIEEEEEELDSQETLAVPRESSPNKWLQN